MKRFLHIDFLRAAAILAVIAIHVFSDTLTTRFVFLLWNYLHFIIIAFVFCSGYVMYALYAPKLTNFSAIFPWYKKRLFRLLVPLYWYLLIHYALLLLFPAYFSGLGLIFSWKFILESMLLFGGINLNWLPLLFLQLAVLFPLLAFLFHRHKNVFYLYILMAGIVTIGFTIWQFPYQYYREVMWIPWSLFLVLPWYFYTREQKAASPLLYSLLAAGCVVCFAGLYILWSHLGRSVTLIDNKYPPNLFYITYEGFGSFLLLGVFFRWNLLQKSWVVHFYQFVSKTSYSLFFIHYIILDLILSLSKRVHWLSSVWYQLFLVMGISLCIAWTLSHVQSVFRKLSVVKKGILLLS